MTQKKKAQPTYHILAIVRLSRNVAFRVFPGAQHFVLRRVKSTGEDIVCLFSLSFFSSFFLSFFQKKKRKGEK